MLYSITLKESRSISSLNQLSLNNKYDNVKQKVSAGNRGTEMYDYLKTTPYSLRIKITRVA